METYKVNSKKKNGFQHFGSCRIMLLFIAVMTGFIERIFGLFIGDVNDINVSGGYRGCRLRIYIERIRI